MSCGSTFGMSWWWWVDIPTDVCRLVIWMTAYHVMTYTQWDYHTVLSSSYPDHDLHTVRLSHCSVIILPRSWPTHSETITLLCYHVIIVTAYQVMIHTVRLSHCSVILLSGSQHIRSWPTQWDYHTVLSSCYQGHSISGHDLHTVRLSLFCHHVIRVTAYQVMTYTVRLPHCSVILLSGSQHIRSWPTQWDYHTVLSSCYQGHSISGHDLHTVRLSLFCHHVIRVTAYQVMTYTVRLPHCSVIMLSGSQHIRSWPTHSETHTVLSSCYQGHSISGRDLHTVRLSHCSVIILPRSWPTHSETITLFCHLVIRVTAYQVMIHTQWDYHTVLSSCYQGHSISGHDLHTVRLSHCSVILLSGSQHIRSWSTHSETITLFCHHVIRVTAYQVMTYTQWDYHTVLSSSYPGHDLHTVRLCSVIMLSGSQHIRSWPTHSETITLFCHHVIRVTAYQVMTYTQWDYHTVLSSCYQGHSISGHYLHTVWLSHCSVILLSGSQHIRSWPTQWDYHTVLSSCYQGHSISDHDLHTVRLSHCSVIMLSGSQHIRSWPTHSETITLFCHHVIRVTAYQVMTYTQWDYHTVLSSCYQGHSISDHDLHTVRLSHYSVIILPTSWPTHSETITLFCHHLIRVTVYQIMTYTQWYYHTVLSSCYQGHSISGHDLHTVRLSHCSVVILPRSWPTHSETITLFCHHLTHIMTYTQWDYHTVLSSSYQGHSISDHDLHTVILSHCSVIMLSGSQHIRSWPTHSETITLFCRHLTQIMTYTQWDYHTVLSSSYQGHSISDHDLHTVRLSHCSVIMLSGSQHIRSWPTHSETITLFCHHVIRVTAYQVMTYTQWDYHTVLSSCYQGHSISDHDLHTVRLSHYSVIILPTSWPTHSETITLFCHHVIRVTAYQVMIYTQWDYHTILSSSYPHHNLHTVRLSHCSVIMLSGSQHIRSWSTHSETITLFCHHVIRVTAYQVMTYIQWDYHTVLSSSYPDHDLHTVRLSHCSVILLSGSQHIRSWPTYSETITLFCHHVIRVTAYQVMTYIQWDYHTVLSSSYPDHDLHTVRLSHCSVIILSGSQYIRSWPTHSETITLFCHHVIRVTAYQVMTYTQWDYHTVLSSCYQGHSISGHDLHTVRLSHCSIILLSGSQHIRSWPTHSETITLFCHHLTHIMTYTQWDYHTVLSSCYQGHSISGHDLHTVRLSHYSVIILPTSWPTHSETITLFCHHVIRVTAYQVMIYTQWDYHTVLSSCYQRHSISDHDLHTVRLSHCSVIILPRSWPTHSETITLFCHLVIRVTAYQVMIYTQWDYHTVLSSCYQGHSISGHDLHTVRLSHCSVIMLSGSQHIRSWPTHSETITLFCHHVIRVTAYQVMTYIQWDYHTVLSSSYPGHDLHTVRLSHCSIILLSGSQHIRSWPTHSETITLFCHHLTHIMTYTQWDYHTVLSSCYQGHSISGHDLHTVRLSHYSVIILPTSWPTHSETITLFCHHVIRVTAYQVMIYTQWDYHTVLSSCYQGHSISDHDLHTVRLSHCSVIILPRSWPTHSETITLFCHLVIRVTAYQVMIYTQWDYHTVLSSCYQGHSISGHDLHTVRLSHCSVIMLSGSQHIRSWPTHSETITLFCHHVIRVTAYQVMTYTQWDYHTVLSSCYQGHSISGHDLHTVRLSHCSVIMLSGSQHIRSWPTHSETITLQLWCVMQVFRIWCTLGDQLACPIMVMYETSGLQNISY